VVELVKRVVLLAFALTVLLLGMFRVQAQTVHDVAVASVGVVYPWGATEAMGIYPSWKINVTVAVRNEGNFTESFNVTIYYNQTSTEWVNIGNQNVTDLAAGGETTLTFLWDTTGVSPSVVNHTYTVYAIKTEASEVPDEADVTNNVRIEGTVWIKMWGDVDGDGKVTGIDAAIFGGPWWSIWSWPRYNPRCDFDGNGNVKGFDAALFAANWWRDI